MTPQPRFRSTRLAAAGLVLALALPAIVAAQPEVEIQLNARQAFVGEAFSVSIEVSGFQDADTPVWPKVDGATVRQLGAASESSFVSIVGGRRTESHSRTWQFELTPDHVGMLTIPPVSVQVDGQTLQTRTMQIEVRPSDVQQYFEVTVAVDQPRIYVGQRVRATMTIWIKPPIFNGRRVSPNPLWGSIVNSSPNFGPFPKEVANADNVVRRHGAGDAESQWYAFDLVADVIVDRAGTLDLGEIEIGLEYPTATGRRYFRVHPALPPIDVKPVPTEGRPADFAGAVGLYSIESRANPTNVRVGDPIELTIDLLGEGPLATLPPPLLTSNTALRENFRLPDDALAGEMKDGRRRFSLVIRAMNDAVKEIPPIEYPYFDPRAERFVVARSKPIPLTVTPVAKVEGVDLSRLSAAAKESRDSVQSLDGLRDIETHESLLLATTETVPAPVVITLLFAPPALFFGTWMTAAFVQYRFGDPVSRRRSRARRAAVARLNAALGRPPGEVAAAITAALSGYLADRRNEPAARWSGGAMAANLRELGVTAPLADRVGALASQCEAAEFAGIQNGAVEQLAAEARACIDGLERERL